jgi:hypothetical protein
VHTTTPELSLDAVRSFVEDYAHALVSGDTAEIAACFALPAMVIRDGGASVAIRRGDVASSFAALARQEPERWHRRVVPVLRRAETLGAGLLSVDVHWHRTGSDGEPTGEPQRYRYLLRAVDGRLRIHVAVGPFSDPLTRS